MLRQSYGSDGDTAFGKKRIRRNKRRSAKKSFLASLVSVVGVVGMSHGVAGALDVGAGENDIPIVGVELEVRGNIVTQNTQATGTVEHSTDSYNIVSVTVNEGAGDYRLEPYDLDMSIVDISFPAGLTGVSVWENGVEMGLDDPNVAEGIARVFASPDLQDYLSYDALSIHPSTWPMDFDVVFDEPVGRENYLLVVERGGNADFHLSALDDNLEPFAGIAATHFTSNYAWNTGHAPVIPSGASQPFSFNVIDLRQLLPASAGSTTGFRMDNNGEADVKLFLARIPTPGDISLVSTVYPGHDGGVGCGTATNTTQAAQTESVTYCFTVTNTGTSYLTNLDLTNGIVPGSPILISADSTPLAPGDSATYYLEAVPPQDGLDGSVDNMFSAQAAVTARQADAGGLPLAGSPALSANDNTTVHPSSAGISLSTSVYAGHDSGHGCTAAETTIVAEGDDITYCLQVTNTGPTFLDNLVFNEPLMGGTVVGHTGLFGPGETRVLYINGTAPALPPGGYEYMGKVTANPVDSLRADLVGIADVTSEDPATVLSPGAQQLALTGWATWMLASMGVVMVGGGWWMMQNSGGGVPGAAGQHETDLQSAFIPVNKTS